MDVFWVVFGREWSRNCTWEGGGLVKWEMFVGMRRSTATAKLSWPAEPGAALIEDDHIKQIQVLVDFGRGWSRVYT